MADGNTPREPKLFHVGDILSVINDRNLTLRQRPSMPDGTVPPPRGYMIGVYEILSFMTGTSISDLEIPRANKEARALLLEKYPALKDIKIPRWTEKDTDKACIAYRKNKENATELTDAIQKFIAPLSDEQKKRIRKKLGSAEDIAKEGVRFATQYYIKNRGYCTPWNPMSSLWETAYDKPVPFPMPEDIDKSPFWPVIGAAYIMIKKLSDHIERQHDDRNATAMKDLEKACGAAYLPVPPLKHFASIDPYEEATSYGYKGAKLNFTSDAEADKAVEMVFYNLSAEEVAKMPPQEHKIVAQGVLALANKHITELVLEPENIRQKEGFVDISLGTMDHRQANKDFANLMRIMPKKIIGPYAELGANFDGENDEYVIRINAAQMRKEGAEKTFMDYVNHEVGITPQATQDPEKPSGQGKGGSQIIKRLGNFLRRNR